MHPIRREKAVLDSLAQAVFVKGIPEVTVGVDVFLSKWCCGHSKLISGTEVLQNPTPRAFVVGATPVALVHDYEIEEIRSERLEQTFPSFVFRERLINCKIDFTSVNDFACLD